MICGPGGVGKGTIASRLSAKVKGLSLSRSWTTRARRRGEPKDSYYFVTRQQFEDAIVDDKFLEWAEFLGNLYGTPKPESDVHTDLLLEIDIQGAKQVREKDPNAVIILLIAPSSEEQRHRMELRGDNAETIAERVSVGQNEVAEALKFADKVVVNDDLDRAVSEISSIINSLRSAGTAS